MEIMRVKMTKRFNLQKKQAIVFVLFFFVFTPPMEVILNYNWTWVEVNKNVPLK